MHARIQLMLLAGIVVVIRGWVRGEDRPAPEQQRQAIERGLSWLQTDAAQWRTERQCSTCHHGLFTVWALSEAKHQGYPISDETISDVSHWTRERLDRIDQPRDVRPGWSMVNTPAMYLALMAQAVPDQTAISPDELRSITGHLLRHQEADGSWSWATAPPKNRPPPFFESDEVATRLASLALGGSGIPQAFAARQRADNWLATSPANDTTQAAALRLLCKVQADEALEPELKLLLSRQNSDGGWGQVSERPSDAYATGQTLYTLRLAGLPADRPEIQRGVSFLVTTQKPDGSWPMTRRGHPGVTPGDNLVPITYFGSAWGTLGLLRSEVKGTARR